jgi:hypothetical protein
MRAAGEAGRSGLRPNRVCEACSAPFYGSPGHVRHGWAKFCSMRCRSTNMIGARNFRWKAEGETKCRWCGKFFHQKPTAKRHRAKVWCSEKCRSAAVSKVVYCARCDGEILTHKCRYPKYCAVCWPIVRAENAKKANRICINCHSWFHRKQCDLNRTSTKGVGRFCSMRCKAKWMSSHPKNNAFHSGKREDLGGIFFRSRWEANWARYLEWMRQRGEIHDWRYEADTFEFKRIKRGIRFYTPDFKITESNGAITYQEVKGWMNSESITKLKRMAKYFPGVKIILIQRAQYYDLMRKLSKVIPNWEFGEHE